MASLSIFSSIVFCILQYLEESPTRLREKSKAIQKFDLHTRHDVLLVLGQQADTVSLLRDSLSKQLCVRMKSSISGMETDMTLNILITLRHLLRLHLIPYTLVTPTYDQAPKDTHPETFESQNMSWKALSISVGRRV